VVSTVRRNRALAKMAATLGGFFWMPCPACGVEFGGHEWGDVNGHFADRPENVRRVTDGRIVSFTGSGICPDCTEKGVGCRAHAEIGRFHVGCEFAQPKER
jgi:hypothetical protein